MSMVQVTMKGTKEVALMLGKDIPVRLRGAAKESMDQSIADIDKSLRRDMKKSKFTGESMNSITTRLEGAPGQDMFIGRIGPDVEKYQWVEYGRGPGKMPPLEAIKAWTAKKLGDESLAFVIARSIASKGTLKDKRPPKPRGWRHLSTVRKRRRTRVRRYWRENVARAIRISK